MARNRKGEQGYALVTVLWIAALLALISLAVVQESRAHLQSLQAMQSRIQARVAAEAAIARHIARLRGAAAPDSTRNSAGGSRARVSLESHLENAKLDLNIADGEALKIALASITGPERAVVLADRIMDWRDSDDLARLAGAEMTEYQNAGRTLGPRNGPFAHVAELTQVLGISRPLAVRLSEVLSVYSGSRNQNSSAEIIDVSNASSGGVASGRRESGIYSIVARAQVARATVTARAVVLVDTGPNGSYRFLSWVWN